MTVKIRPKALNETHVIIADAELKALIEIIETQSQEHVEMESDILVTVAELRALIEVIEHDSQADVEQADDVDSENLMKLSDGGGALDFLLDEREDIYTVDDLKILYQ